MGKRIGLLKNLTFYKNNLGDNDLFEQGVDEKRELKCIDVGSKDILVDTFNVLKKSVFYISDIHLNHKIKKEFPKFATFKKIEKFIEEKIVDKITLSVKDFGELIIAGDVSFNYEISEIFYRKLVKKWKRGKIFVVLGNHELWDYGRKKSNKEDIVKTYRNLFESLGIVFLENNLYFKKRKTEIKLTEEEILHASQEELKALANGSGYIILGGLGFSGYEKRYNASCGLYRDAIPSLEEDVKRTKRFEAIYKKVRTALGNNKVIVLTHTPKDNWSKDDYNNEWIYVNGHTHRNVFIKSNYEVYADNQVGYYSNNYALKYFRIQYFNCAICGYGDGIYKITVEQYIDFYNQYCQSIKFSKKEGQIYMLKRQGIYCFVYRNEQGVLYLLNGGARITADKDIEYYYNNMVSYYNKLKESMQPYENYQRRIAKEVKDFGGDGNIHGCIIDIDYFNHLFVNPLDRSVIPYYAESMTNKVVYSNMESLLHFSAEEYIESFEECKRKNKELALINSDKRIRKGESSTDTRQYSISRYINTIKYATNLKIIRIWKDDIFNNEDNKLLLN